MDDDEFLSCALSSKTKIKFGLEAQGHIETIETMLDDYCGWDEINKAIGWAGDAAQNNYITYLRRKVKSLTSKDK